MREGRILQQLPQPQATLQGASQVLCFGMLTLSPCQRLLHLPAMCLHMATTVSATTSRRASILMPL